MLFEQFALEIHHAPRGPRVDFTPRFALSWRVAGGRCAKLAHRWWAMRQLSASPTNFAKVDCRRARPEAPASPIKKF